ncbi:hypothetical protein DACRYDRAFT_25130 [Dacryopinax primogenitus]|uniref:Uncharacterized protein n=1 Tax=Dacryopinax primogenitus (strain DJM 731) TaxID=1858805 RepID=M5G0M5_DACPD|nr:uncharacterized protein DACRYDRAFT_25130 [Dacryopinax primogenitus]EJT97352.1 hypothetical protein DACRYDRAFT_25130 [Dacryopinax primogenitus]
MLLSQPLCVHSTAREMSGSYPSDFIPRLQDGVPAIWPLHLNIFPRPGPVHPTFVFLHLPFLLDKLGGGSFMRISGKVIPAGCVDLPCTLIEAGDVVDAMVACGVCFRL